MSSNNLRVKYWSSIIVPLLLSVFFAQHFWPHISDDGAIFFRYANNLAGGDGPVWNVGEPVEGFSSPLWMLLLSLGVVLGGSVVTTAKLLGVGCAFGTLLILGLSLQKKSEPEWVAFSVIGASLTAGLFYWAPSGMETPLVALLWAAVWWKWETKAGLLPLALLGLARPEGPLLIIGAIGLWWFSARRIKPRDLLCLLPYALWFVFRFWFYGDVLPNTYYAKVGAPLTERLMAGWGYCYPILAVWVCAFIGQNKDERPRFLWLLLGILSVLWGGGDWMWWGRLLVPFSVLLWASFPTLINGRWWLLFPFFWGVSHVLLPYKAVLACLQLKTLPEIGWQEGTLMQSSQEQADVIRKILPKGSQIAVNHAGFLPYMLSEYNFIDMTGLNDRHIAHNTIGGLHQKYDPDYVLSLKPEAIIFHRRSLPPESGMLADLDYWVGETELAAQPEFQANYSVLGNYWIRKSSGGGTVYTILALRH